MLVIIDDADSLLAGQQDQTRIQPPFNVFPPNPNEIEEVRETKLHDLIPENILTLCESAHVIVFPAESPRARRPAATYGSPHLLPVLRRKVLDRIAGVPRGKKKIILLISILPVQL